MRRSKILSMSIRQVSAKHQGHVLQHLSERLIISDNCMQERWKVSIYDSMQAIIVSTQPNEHALPATGMAIKKWNCNFCRIPISLVNSVTEKDIRRKSWQSSEEGKLFPKSWICMSRMLWNFFLRSIISVRTCNSWSISAYDISEWDNQPIRFPEEKVRD